MNASVVVEQNPEAYIHSYITYPDKRRMNWYYTEMLIYVPWCLACPFAPSITPRPPPPLVESTMEFKTTLPCPLLVLVFVVLLLVFGGIRVPGEPLFVERDDHLRTLDVGLLCRHQVGFIWIFPAQGQKKPQIQATSTQQTDVLALLREQTISWGTWVLPWNLWRRWSSLEPAPEQTPSASLAESPTTPKHAQIIQFCSTRIDKVCKPAQSGCTQTLQQLQDSKCFVRTKGNMLVVEENPLICLWTVKLIRA